MKQVYAILIWEVANLLALDKLGHKSIRLRTEDSNCKGLTAAQCQFYQKNGYLVLPDILTSEETDALLNEAHDTMKYIAKGGKGVILHNATEVELPSPAGRVLATFETASPPSSLLRPISRLGCGVHQHLPNFHAVTHSHRHRAIAASLGYLDPHVTQSQVIAKLAGVGSRIVPHQDGCASFTDPPSATTFWYALEDATSENGCLCVAAGSHLTEPLRQRFIRGERGATQAKRLETPLWAKGGEGGERGSRERPREYQYTPLEVKKGALILFHGNLMHQSGANRSRRDRAAYVFSIVEGQLECPSDNMIPKEAMNRL